MSDRRPALQAPSRTTRSSSAASSVPATVPRPSIQREAKSSSKLGAPSRPTSSERQVDTTVPPTPRSKKPKVAAQPLKKPTASSRAPPPPPAGGPPKSAAVPQAVQGQAPVVSPSPPHDRNKPAVAGRSDTPASSNPDTPVDNQSLQVLATIECIQSAPKGSGSDLLFPASAHPRLRKSLPDQDISGLLQLPQDCLSLGDVLAPLVSQTPTANPKSIESRFDNFLAVEAHKLAEVFGADDSRSPSVPSPRPSLGLVVSFFTAEGQAHGSRTHSHQCDDSGCIRQSCCPKEYNMSSVESYAARLALRFPDFAPVLHGKDFKKYIRDGLSRQQTDGRHSLPAPPMLQPHAEATTLEGYASVKKHNATFLESRGRARADAAFHACRDAQDLARFTADLASGARANF